MQFRTLISGSSGNCVLLSANNTNILIDCGTSGKNIAACLLNTGVSPTCIDYILVTHEHSDHAQGVGVMSRRYDIPVIASIGTFENMEIGELSYKNTIAFSDYHKFEINGIVVTPFEIPHDAAMPTGYRFDIDSRSCAVATDMGHITAPVKDALCGCEVVILESNYDENMLMTGPYPYVLKRRIGGTHGHLCNDDAATLGCFLVRNNTKHIVLGHLSKENNSPETAYTTVAKEMDISGIKIGRDVMLSIAPRYSVGENAAS